MGQKSPISGEVPVKLNRLHGTLQTAGILALEDLKKGLKSGRLNRMRETGTARLAIQSAESCKTTSCMALTAGTVIKQLATPGLS